MKHLVLLVACMLAVASCTVQKRKYQKGFYLGWRHSATETKAAPIQHFPAARAESIAAKKLIVPVAAVHSETTADAVLASSSVNAVPLFKKKQVCDVLIFNDGSEVEGKVTELNETEVKYKRCDMPDGPVYSVKKSSLFMIKYANGTREIFKSEKTATPAVISEKNKRTHPLAITAFILGLLGIWPLTVLASIPALILGTIALKKIKKDPDTYKGEGFALAGQILGGIIVGLFVLVLIIVLALVL